MAVQVLHVPASVPAEELRDLFGQLGPVTSIVMTYDPARKESDALVVYERAAAPSADEAVDLFDSYPLHGSLLEVQLVQSVHQYTAQLTANLSQQTAASADAVATPPGAHYASLEAEMRDLQLHLQQHASELQQPTAPQQQAEHNSGREEGWQSIASAPRRRPQHATEAAAAGPASSTSSGGAGAGSAAEAPPNRG
jgi:RNA recognition motif-containing protein